VGSLALGAALSAVPIVNAVKVLKSELAGLHTMVTSTDMDTKEAVKEAQRLLKNQLPESTLLAFSTAVEGYRKVSMGPAGGAQKAAVAELKNRAGLISVARNTCMTQLLMIRFNRLMWSLAFPGFLVLAAFVTFAWAANPPGDPVRLLARPYFIEVPQPSLGPQLARRKAGSGLPHASESQAAAGPGLGQPKGLSDATVGAPKTCAELAVTIDRAGTMELDRP
jgi:hypothetical protein